MIMCITGKPYLEQNPPTNYKMFLVPFQSVLMPLFSFPSLEIETYFKVKNSLKLRQ